LERVAFQEKDIRDIARKHGLDVHNALPGIETEELLKIILEPSKEPYWKMSSREIFFLTTIDRTPDFYKSMLSLAEAAGYPASEVGVYVQPIHQGVGCHCEFSLTSDPNPAKDASAYEEFFNKASEGLAEKGAFFSRPYGIWSDLAFNKDAQTTSLLKKVKKIFDPNGVMNPGKLCF
jgi:FAD/FMN-containing dehydrogenase